MKLCFSYLFRCLPLQVGNCLPAPGASYQAVAGKILSFALGNAILNKPGIFSSGLCNPFAEMARHIVRILPIIGPVTHQRCMPAVSVPVQFFDIRPRSRPEAD
ncbi:MAG: hypothetical protein ACQES8_03495 [Thermodesulfobacteriota bacterium]